MSYSRREFGKFALAALPAAALLETPLFGSAARQAKPNSKFGGVQIGVITYSYRSMPDQSAEATLKYVLAAGINAIELMDGPAEMFAGAPVAPARGGGAGPGAPGGGRRAGGGGAGRGAAPAAAAAVPLLPGQPSWNGQPCAPGRGARGAAPGGRAAAARGAAAGAAVGADAARGGGAGGRGTQSPEEAAHQEALKRWRTSVSMDKFKELRRMYNDAGVTMYAYKPDGLNPKDMQTSDAEFDYVFNVASVLGASHLTMELPREDEADVMLKRMAQFAEKHKVYVAFHTHAQGSMTAFDQALATSPWIKSNVDFGHYVAAGNVGGTPIQFLEKFHDRIASFHLKDRTLPEHCSLTLPFGTGDGMLKEILLLVKKNKWTFPATIELEYTVPSDSDAVQEVKKCVDFARGVLA